MAKGKYSARSANRLAQLDNELVADLKSKLRAAESDRDRLAAELQVERNKTTSALQHKVEAAVAAERASLAAAAEQINIELEVWKASVADELMDLLGWWCDRLAEQYGTDRIFPSDVMKGDSDGAGLLHLLEILDSKGAGAAHVDQRGGGGVAMTTSIARVVREIDQLARENADLAALTADLGDVQADRDELFVEVLALRAKAEREGKK